MADLMPGLEGMGREHREETMIIFMFLGLQDLEYTKKVVDFKKKKNVALASFLSV